MFMYSGDIMVMLGFSRLLNYVVSRVFLSLTGESLFCCLEIFFSVDFFGDLVVEFCFVEDWQVCVSYLKIVRVNMIVRQVLVIDQDFFLEFMEENKRDIILEGVCRLDDENS